MNHCIAGRAGHTTTRGNTTLPERPRQQQLPAARLARAFQRLDDLQGGAARGLGHRLAGQPVAEAARRAALQVIEALERTREAGCGELLLAGPLR